MSVAAVRDSSFVTAFEFLGAYGFIAENEEAVKEALRRLVHDDKGFKLIILSEKFADCTRYCSP
jgi:vacuolar-type H+-ATPase subunit F/Vma7